MAAQIDAADNIVKGIVFIDANHVHSGLPVLLHVAVAATFAVLVVSILVVLRLARSISLPVKRVTDRMVTLSSGDGTGPDGR